MAVQPYAGEFFRLSAEIDLIFKEIRHRFVVELHTDTGHFLFDRDEVRNKEQVIGLGNAETSYFVVRLVSEIKQLCPCSRAEPQC